MAARSNTKQTARNTPQKKKRSKFRTGLLISVMVAFIAILIGLIWFFNWLSDYEASERHHVAEQMLTECSAGNFGMVAARTDVVMSGLESQEVYAEEIGKRMSGKQLTYTKAFSYDRFEHPAYKIFADGEYVCKLVLKKDGKSKYKFDKYAVDYFTAFDFGVGKVAFLLPDYYEVYCNGKKLDDIYAVKTGLNPGLMKYAFTDSDAPSLTRYEITGLTSRCDIVAKDPYGGSVTLEEREGVYEAAFESLRFSVPDGVNVSVGGIRLGDKYVVPAADGDSADDSKTYAPLLFSDQRVNGFVNYRVDYISPGTDFIAVDKNGREVKMTLGSDGVYRAGINEYTVIAPDGLEVKAGDTVISGASVWRVRTGGEVDELKTILTKYLPERPTMAEYRFSVIGGDEAPAVTVRNVIGDVLTLAPDESGTYEFSFVIDHDVPEYTGKAVSFTKKYAEYITNDMDHDSFMKLILFDQPMYAELDPNPFYFYTGHKKHWFENESWSDLRVYSDKCFSCEVKFDYYIGQIKTDANFVKMLPLDIKFWIVDYGGKWYLADWQLM
ncbi:MAG: hypothetical protein IKI42_01015 [Clostridia bacterium]|nr:hypothetical protein [Clostridia bacterium]MBR7061597.1 hypothetical protein [Clostridia bacterium]